MSEHAPLARLAACMLLLAGAARAQTGTRDSSLDDRYRAAAARVHELDERVRSLIDARTRAAPPYTITEGVVTIRVDSAALADRERRALRDDARRASEAIVRVQGAAAPRALEALEFVATPRRASDGSPEVLLRVRGWAAGTHELWADVPLRAERVTDYLESIAGEVATARLDPEMASWSSAPGAMPEPREWDQAAIFLYAAPSTIARRCMHGSDEDCERILGLTPRLSVLERFYTPEDYPSVVERTWSLRTIPTTFADTIRSCIHARVASACDVAVRLTPASDAVPGSVRRTLLAVALEIGGDRAFDRLLSARGPARGQLLAAAGIPADSLFSRWRARVAAARPSHGFALPAVASFGWATLLLFLARRRPTCG
jgi:hypothetical protein